MSSYKITPFLSMHIFTSNPQIFHHSCICGFFPHKNNINLNNTTLLQTALQQALLGDTPWSQESIAQDKHSGPNFIICGTVTSLHSCMNDDDRICLVPNHIQFVLEAARDLSWCIAQLLVVQVLLWPRISSVVVGTVLNLFSTKAKFFWTPTVSQYHPPPLCCHPLIISGTVSLHYWDLFPKNSLKAIMRVMASLIWVFASAFPHSGDSFSLPRRDLLHLSPLRESLDRSVGGLPVHHLPLGAHCWRWISCGSFISEPRESIQPCGTLGALLVTSFSA